MLTPTIAYQHFAFARFPYLPHVGNCAGTETAAVLGCGLISSYLVLFINFYIQTYQKPAKGGKPVANSNRHGYDCTHCMKRWLTHTAGLNKSEVPQII